ncbi:MAG TPA: hypothetical protein VKE27_12990, partial [Candidatus Dormibacteraeota bacterium]|nr:hypothetical protein [Candidatus Dormibacteraeota bacterium]
MSKVAARLSMVAVLVLCAGYVLQAQDSAFPAAAPPVHVAEAQPLLTSPGIGGREYFTRHHEVV